MTDTTAHVGDRRRAPFCYQTHAALDAIREAFTGAHRSTAIAVYVVLTEAANRSGGAAARDGFQAQRRDLADLAGISARTLDRYVPELERIGVLVVERRRVGSVNLPNVWTLVEPGENAVGGPPGDVGDATLASPTSPLAREQSLGKEENLEKSLESGRPEVDEPKRPAIVGSVDRRPVTVEEATLAELVLTRWNRRTGQDLRSRDWLAKIVMRIREYPDLDGHAHDAIIRHALAHPWWSGAPTPSVVYGSGAQFERSLTAWRTGDAGGREGVTAEQLYRHAEALRRQGR